MLTIITLIEQNQLDFKIKTSFISASLPPTIFSLSRFFEVITVNEMRNISINENVTEMQEVVTYDIADLRMDPSYIRCLCQQRCICVICAVSRYYINWTRLVFTCTLPVIFLIILNYKIFRGIRYISVNCEIMKLCLRLSHMRSRTSVKKEINLASILVCIVFVFLFCNIPRVFINCYEFLSSEEVIR